MLVLNKEVIFLDKSVLTDFCREMMLSSYDDSSRLGNAVFTQHMQEAFDADIRLTEMVHENIGEDLMPIVLYEFCNTCDLNKFDFFLMSTEENREVLKREEMLYYDYCDRCFGHIQGLIYKLNTAFEQAGL